jgi:hypothetical protein
MPLTKPASRKADAATARERGSMEKDMGLYG